MDKFRSSRENRLADALRSEALADRPEFSQELHARLREAVGQAPRNEPIAPAPARQSASTTRRERLLRTVTAVAAVAACLFAALLVIQSLPFLQPDSSGNPREVVENPQEAPASPEVLPGPPVLENPPAVPAIDENMLADDDTLPSRATTEAVRKLLDASGMTMQFEEFVEMVRQTHHGAALDHDARLLATTLTEPFPVDLMQAIPLTDLTGFATEPSPEQTP